MGNAYTAVVLGGVVAAAAVADEVAVVVGDGAGDDVESVTDGVEGAVVTHKDEARVGMSGRTQGQVGDNVPLPESGLAAEF